MRRHLTRAGAAALLTLIAACGGSGGSDADASSGADEPTTTAATTDDGAGAADDPEPDEVAGRQVPTPGTQPAGRLTISAELCDLGDVAFEAGSSSDALSGVAVVGDVVYLVGGEGDLRRFVADTDDGCTLELDTSWATDGVHTPDRPQEAVDTGGDVVVVSGDVFGAEVLDAATGSLLYSCDGAGEVVVAPDGSGGLATFPGSPVRALTFGETACEVTEPAPIDAALPFADAPTAIAHLDDGTLLLGGDLGDHRAVVAVGPDGTERWRHGAESPTDEQRYGWVHGLAPCGTGYCAVDTNFSRLQVLGADGAWLTAVDLKALLGLEGSIWWEDLAAGDDGRLWMPVGASRTEGDGADGFLFLVTVE